MNPISLRRYASTIRACLAVALVIGVACAANETPKAAAAATVPTTVTTVSVTQGSITRTLTLPTFRILPYRSATIYAKVSGYLKSLDVDKGDRVTAGQPIAEIEVPELQADEAEFKAEASVGRTNYERMAAAAKRSPDLVVPQTVEELLGKAEVAEAKLQRTRSMLAFAHITAPFGGVVSTRFVDPGAFIPAATAGSTPQSAALLTIMDASRVRVQVAVPESDVPFVRNGVVARIRVEELPGQVFNGTVTRFSPALDEATKTMLAEIELANPTGAVRPGMYANVSLEIERHPRALLLPSDAVAVEKAGTFVFVVNGGTLHKTAVRTGFRDATNIEIVSGVDAGVVVARIGKLALTDGQAVQTAKP